MKPWDSVAERFGSASAKNAESPVSALYVLAVPSPSDTVSDWLSEKRNDADFAKAPASRQHSCVITQAEKYPSQVPVGSTHVYCQTRIWKCAWMRRADQHGSP